MSTSVANRKVIDRIRAAVAAFASREIDLDYMHGVLQSSADLFENDGNGFGDLVRIAETDVEIVRFTRLLDEQRPAVLFILDELLDAFEQARS